MLERAVLLTEGVIKPEHLGIQRCLNISALEEATRTLSETTSAAARQAEGEALSRAPNVTDGNKSKAAELLGLATRRFS